MRQQARKDMAAHRAREKEKTREELERLNKKIAGMPNAAEVEKAKHQRQLLDNELKEIELRQKEGELVSAKIVQAKMAGLLAGYREQFEAVPTNMVRMAKGKGIEIDQDVLDLVRDAVEEALRRVPRG